MPGRIAPAQRLNSCRWTSRIFNLNVAAGANFCFEYTGPVALVAISGISAPIALGMGWIPFVALEALAVTPAPALRVVFATFGFGLANITVFWN